MLATRMAKGLNEITERMYKEYLRERKKTVVRKWGGGEIEFKKMNHPGVWLGSRSQRMPLPKEMVWTLRPETRSSGLCQAALWDETTVIFSLSVPVLKTITIRKTAVGQEEEKREQGLTCPLPFGWCSGPQAAAVYSPWQQRWSLAHFYPCPQRKP